MDKTARSHWIGRATLVGMFYAVVAVGSGMLAGVAGSARMTLLWRWLAFIVSGTAFAWHVAHEVLRERSRALPAAWRASLAAAIGGFGIAVAANLHELAVASGYRVRMLIALAAWPLITGGAAFLMALVAAAGLGTMRPRE